MRNFRILYENKKDLLEKFYIGVEFEEMDLETKIEKVERLLQETQLNPYTDEYIGEQLGDQDYLNHIDTDKRDKQEEREAANPLAKFGKKPGGSSMFSVKDKDTGSVAQVSKKTPV